MTTESLSNNEIRQRIKSWMFDIFDEDVTLPNVKDAIIKIIDKIVEKKKITKNINEDELENILKNAREEL